MMSCHNEPVVVDFSLSPQVTVIFVRHGESAWNEIFNKVAS